MIVSQWTPRATTPPGIRALLEEDCTAQARAVMSEALEANPEDPEILTLDDILKVPMGKPCQVTDPDPSAEFEWIVANRDASTEAVAWQFDGTRLVADASSFAELQSRIKNRESVPLVHRID